MNTANKKATKPAAIIALCVCLAAFWGVAYSNLDNPGIVVAAFLFYVALCVLVYKKAQNRMVVVVASLCYAAVCGFLHYNAMNLVVLGVVSVFYAALCGSLFLTHFLLTLPMRRAERARQFLELMATARGQGQPVEQTIISVAQSRDLSMGPRFHLVAAWLEQNLTLRDALAKVPRFLPPQVTAMLAAGLKIGDLQKVLPACRQLLKDAVSQTRGAMHYLVILTFVLTPFGIYVIGVLRVFVMPKFLDIANGIGMNSMTGGIEFFLNHLWTMVGIQSAFLCILWMGAFFYIGSPRFMRRSPIVQRFRYSLPWRRKRLQRDFSTMLAILLDSGVSEAEAVTLAADCTANEVICTRARRAVEGLKNGLKLTQAVQLMDDSGEFAWRLGNAVHGGGDFFRALAGWHESLDAKAFQQEQAAAHGITSALVLWSGLLVGGVALSVYGFLISIINEGVLW